MTDIGQRETSSQPDPRFLRISWSLIAFGFVPSALSFGYVFVNGVPRGHGIGGAPFVLVGLSLLGLLISATFAYLGIRGSNNVAKVKLGFPIALMLAMAGFLGGLALLF